MKAISLWQPWASLVAAKVKNYETRSWAPPKSIIGQRIAICAAKTTKGFKQLDGTHGGTHLEHLIFEHFKCCFTSLPTGVIVATAKVSAFDKTENVRKIISTNEFYAGDYADGRFAWDLDDIRPIRSHIEITGRQGLFNIPEHTIRVLKEAGYA